MMLRQLIPCADCVKLEAWLPVPGYEDLYLISSQGRVKAMPKVVMRTNGRAFPCHERILRPGKWRSGHLFVILANLDHVQDRRGVHRLVLEAFVGPCPSGHECLHTDDVPDHNHRANLRWGTRAENFADRKRLTGRIVPWTKLTDEDVRAIRASSGLTQRVLADQYEVCQPVIHSVLAGKTHRSVT